MSLWKNNFLSAEYYEIQSQRIKHQLGRGNKHCSSYWNLRNHHKWLLNDYINTCLLYARISSVGNVTAFKLINRMHEWMNVKPVLRYRFNWNQLELIGTCRLFHFPTNWWYLLDIIYIEPLKLFSYAEYDSFIFTFN